jgi:hypothetical protein
VSITVYLDLFVEVLDVQGLGGKLRLLRDFRLGGDRLFGGGGGGVVGNALHGDNGSSFDFGHNNWWMEEGIW